MDSLNNVEVLGLVFCFWNVQDSGPVVYVLCDVCLGWKFSFIYLVFKMFLV